MRNQHLAEMILKTIDTFPETFNMNYWGIHGKCGTVACLAGHAMLLSGYTLSSPVIPTTPNTYISPKGRTVILYGEEAQSLLGMSTAERYCNEKDEYLGDIFLDLDSGLDRFRALAEHGES